MTVLCTMSIYICLLVCFVNINAHVHHYRVNSLPDLHNGMKNQAKLLKRSPQGSNQCNCPYAANQPPAPEQPAPVNPGIPPPQENAASQETNPSDLPDGSQGSTPEASSNNEACNIQHDTGLNLRLSDQSGDHSHPTNGRILNKGELDSIQKALGIPHVSYFVQKLDSIPGAYCQGKSPDEKTHGGYIVMSTAMKLKIMPAAKWSGCDTSQADISSPNSCEMTAGKVYGALKVAGKNGDGATVRQILTENGGNTFGLCDNMLMWLWGGNEHQYLHHFLCHEAGSPPEVSTVFHGIHITSLSDKIGVNAYWGPKVPKDLGGFNNHGEWPEKEWFQSAMNYPQVFPEVF